jgi:dTDP-4-amino-4,6-dideoxygalactose transaminase
MDKPVRKEFLVFGAPDIHQKDIDEVVASLKSGWWGTGPKVMKFERDFAAYKGVQETHVAAVNSCTAALHVSLIAAGIGPGHEVITTPMTFCATVNSIIHCGARPVLADINPLTMNIDPHRILAKITPKTKAISLVHFAGRPCDMDAILEIARQHDLTVIEDCAHAIETEYHGKKAGTIGDFGCFSFYVTKNVATGEGGMIISRDERVVARSKILALHGMTKDAWRRYGDEGHVHYLVVESGFKYNMMDIQGALGIHQLARVETNWLRRQTIWQRYQKAFKDLPVGIPTPPEPDTRHAYHLYTLLIDESKTGVNRDQFLDEMIKNNVGVGVHYLSIPEHPFYRDRFNWRGEDFPHAMAIGRQTVSLPLSPALSDEDVTDVITAVTKVINRAS